MVVSQRVLVLRALGLGDLLAGVPALKALRAACPAAEISLAGPASHAALINLMPFVDRHVVAEELQPVPWTGRPPEVAVDLHGNGPASRNLLRVLSPERLVGFSSAALPHEDGPWWDDDEPERERWCRLVEESFGVVADPQDTRIERPLHNSPAPGAVVVHPGAAYAARRWPPERYAAVARELSGHHPVVVTGGPTEAALARDVTARAGLPAASALTGLDLAALAALIADANLVVCGDTGVAHLASAYGTASVVLFGPTPPRLWGPPQRPQHFALWRGAGRGNPWGEAPDPALLRITVDEAVAACRQVLITGSPATIPQEAVAPC